MLKWKRLPSTQTLSNGVEKTESKQPKRVLYTNQNAISFQSLSIMETTTNDVMLHRATRAYTVPVHTTRSHVGNQGNDYKWRKQIPNQFSINNSAQKSSIFFAPSLAQLSCLAAECGEW